MMRCNIIVHPAHRNGIIGKMALRLAEGARQQGVEVTLDAAPNPDTDVNHYTNFHAVDPIFDSARNTMFITHVDDAYQYAITRKLLQRVDVGICMSRMTVQRLMDSGVPGASLCYVLPAQDCQVRPRRLRIGLTTHLYDDGRKREDFLLRMGSESGLHDFQFEIFGHRWGDVAVRMRSYGAVVNLHEGTGNYETDYREITNAIPEFDYYLYMGLDEGSMGTLDAMAAGVPTIVTNEGFHMDLGVKPDYPFVTYEEMRGAFATIIAKRRQRIDAVAQLTWEEHARQHVIIWEALCAGRREQVRKLLNQENISPESIDGYRRMTLGERIHDIFKLTHPSRWPAARQYYLSQLLAPFKRQQARWRIWSAVVREEGFASAFHHAAAKCLVKIRSAFDRL